MRVKLLFAAAALACSVGLHAQTIPNSSFENWYHSMDGTDSIGGWTSSNDAYQGSTPYWLSQSTPAYGGSFAAKLNSVAFGFVQRPINGILVNGNAYIEHVYAPNENHYYRSGGGTPVSAKPVSISGYYMYQGSAGDHGSGIAVLFKYNPITGVRDTVGKGALNFTNAASWQPFTISINDMMPLVTPDSILTIFYASDTANTMAYEELYLDEITVNLPTGINELSNIRSSVFPNPCTNDAWISMMAPTAGEVRLELFNTQGQLIHSEVHEIEAGANHLRIDTKSFPKGLYYYSLSGVGRSGGGKIVIAE
jgi:hypothetical protein